MPPSRRPGLPSEVWALIGERLTDRANQQAFRLTQRAFRDAMPAPAPSPDSVRNATRALARMGALDPGTRSQIDQYLDVCRTLKDAYRQATAAGMRSALGKRIWHGALKSVFPLPPQSVGGKWRMNEWARDVPAMDDRQLTVELLLTFRSTTKGREFEDSAGLKYAVKDDELEVTFRPDLPSTELPVVLAYVLSGARRVTSKPPSLRVFTASEKDRRTWEDFARHVRRR